MKNRKITSFILTMVFALFGLQISLAQSRSTKVDPFNKVIVSPHIQVTFQQGESEIVTIESSTVSDDKINIEITGSTLRIYLDGAKELTKTEKTYEDGKERRESIYKGTEVKATVTYVNLVDLSLRGEEVFVCKNILTGDLFNLKVFGKSQVFLNDVALGSLHATIYGESYLKIKAGTVDSQRITAYGKSEVNTLGMKSKSARIIAYGEGNYQLTVSDDLKITAYGPAKITYQGNPEVRKGIIIGEATIQQIQ